NDSIRIEGSAGSFNEILDSCARHAWRSASAVGVAHFIQVGYLPSKSWAALRLSDVWITATRRLPYSWAFPARILPLPSPSFANGPSTYAPSHGISMYLPACPFRSSEALPPSETFGKTMYRPLR